jgi:hypothetical protein
LKEQQQQNIDKSSILTILEEDIVAQASDQPQVQIKVAEADIKLDIIIHLLHQESVEQKFISHIHL